MSVKSFHVKFVKIFVT